jgi:polar amino acid transport system permease protein
VVKEKGVHLHLVITMFEWLVEYMPQLLKGFIVTLQLAGIGLAIGSVLGLTLAIIRVYGNRITSIVAAFYVEVVRGTPLLVQIFLMYYGLFMGLDIDRFIAAFLAIGLNSAAYQAEYFRGAIESVSK